MKYKRRPKQQHKGECVKDHPGQCCDCRNTFGPLFEQYYERWDGPALNLISNPLRCGCLNSCRCHALTAVYIPQVDEDWSSGEETVQQLMADKDAGIGNLPLDTPEIGE